MKKVLKLLVAIILAVAILGVIMFLIDCSKINSGKEPIFAKEVSVANDGGTIEYMGLGYKIIDFNRLNGYDETKIGFWNIKYDDYQEEYSKLDENIINNNTDIDNELNEDKEIISGDIINNEMESGDTEITESLSGDVTSGDAINDVQISGDNTNNLIQETNSGDEIKEEGYYFNATIIGINNNNLVVQALENEPIIASADMFSFSLKEDATNYLIGQKVRVKYTGSIRETYPAQIDVLEIKIIE